MRESKQLTPQESFEKKLTDRIRESIGDLMPDEKLAEIVERGMQEAFFKGRHVQERGYHGRTYEEAPWLVSAVKELLEEQAKAEVKKWLAEHPEEVERVMREWLEKGVAEIVVSWIDGQMRWHLQQAVESTLSNLVPRS